jgi:hypothetical protein
MTDAFRYSDDDDDAAVVMFYITFFSGGLSSAERESIVSVQKIHKGFACLMMSLSMNQ